MITNSKVLFSELINALISRQQIYHWEPFKYHVISYLCWEFQISLSYLCAVGWSINEMIPMGEYQDNNNESFKKQIVGHDLFHNTHSLGQIVKKWCSRV